MGIMASVKFEMFLQWRDCIAGTKRSSLFTNGIGNNEYNVNLFAFAVWSVRTENTSIESSNRHNRNKSNLRIEIRSLEINRINLRINYTNVSHANAFKVLSVVKQVTWEPHYVTTKHGTVKN